MQLSTLSFHDSRLEELYLCAILEKREKRKTFGKIEALRILFSTKPLNGIETNIY